MGLFSDGDVPGLGGTGTYDAKGTNAYQVNKDAFYNNEELDADKKQSQYQLGRVEDRAAPTSQAAQLGATNLANAEDAKASYGHASLGSAVTGNALNANNTKIGTAQNAAQVGISRSDDQFRNQQQNLATQLTQAANGQGPSQAGIQLGQANAAATAQRLASAASDRGYGNTAASNRQLAYQQGAAQQANAIASAQTKIQEQQAAQQALGNVLNNARSQDIGVNTSQAGLTQQTNLANQDAQNQFTLQQAQLNQQTALQNAAAGNQFGLANLSALNTQGLTNQAAQNNQSQLNQNTSNQFALANQTADNQFGLANQNAQNQFALQNTANQQQTNLANQDSQLQTMGLNDAQIKALLGISTGIDQQEMANQQAYEDLATGQNTNLNAINQKAYADSAQYTKAGTDEAISAIAGSDENMKTNVSNVSQSDLNKFLSSFSSNSSDTSNSILGSSLSNYLNSGARTKPSSSMAGFGGAMSAMSDEKEKKNIANASEPEVNNFLNTLGGHKYDYKNPNEFGADDKTHYSPMAQELEKSKIGKSMVYQDPKSGTKYVDYARGYGALMAATAELNKRLNKLEGK